MDQRPRPDRHPVGDAVGALTAGDVVREIATAVQTLPGWRISPFAAGNFPGDPEGWGHKAFTVEARSTRLAPGPESSRIRRAALGRADTAIAVRWIWRLPEGYQWSEYCAALDGEAALLVALTRVSGGPGSSDGLHVDWVDTISRQTVADGTWLLSEIAGTARHMLTIQ